MPELGHFRMFFRVQWQPFEDKFGETRSSFTHHIDVLLHSSQSQQQRSLDHLIQTVDLNFTALGKEQKRTVGFELRLKN